jgi:hypothetical protein
MADPLLLGERALQIIADDKLATALAAGEFANLPGLGKPHPIFDEDYDPNWWVRRKLSRENLAALKAERDSQPRR